MKILITGGHHTSALPVITELKRQNEKVDIFWIGHKYSLKGDKNATLEYKEITDLGIPFYDLHAGKVYKTFDPSRLLKIPVGFLEALLYLIKLKPDIILSFGGYLAVPVVVVGYFMGIPSITHEQTVVAGYANKVIKIFAEKILVSWESSFKYFPKNKTVFTGLPLRSEIFEAKTNAFDINNKLPTVYITGGKTGSHIINNAVYDSLKELLKFCNIIHQCGDYSLYKDYENLLDYYSKFDNLAGRYFVRKFIFNDEIGEVFSKANLVVTRAGAHTIYEVIALSKPAILIPIPWVSHNEQYENAKIIQNLGLGKILDEKKLDSTSFTKEIKDTLENIGKMTIMDGTSERLKSIDAAKRIVDEIFKTFRKNSN